MRVAFVIPKRVNSGSVSAATSNIMEDTSMRCPLPSTGLYPSARTSACSMPSMADSAEDATNPSRLAMAQLATITTSMPA